MKMKWYKRIFDLLCTTTYRLFYYYVKLLLILSRAFLYIFNLALNYRKSNNSLQKPTSQIKENETVKVKASNHPYQLKSRVSELNSTSHFAKGNIETVKLSPTHSSDQINRNNYYFNRGQTSNFRRGNFRPRGAWQSRTEQSERGFVSNTCENGIRGGRGRVYQRFSYKPYQTFNKQQTVPISNRSQQVSVKQEASKVILNNEQKLETNIRRPIEVNQALAKPKDFYTLTPIETSVKESKLIEKNRNDLIQLESTVDSNANQTHNDEIEVKALAEVQTKATLPNRIQLEQTTEVPLNKQIESVNDEITNGNQHDEKQILIKSNSYAKYLSDSIESVIEQKNKLLNAANDDRTISLKDVNDEIKQFQSRLDKCELWKSKFSGRDLEVYGELLNSLSQLYDEWQQLVNCINYFEQTNQQSQ